MFMFDIETLATRSDAVILSLAVIHFNPDEKPSPERLREDCFFIKFDVEDQIRRLGRRVDPSTVDWWKKQCENVKRKSVYPTPIDARFEDGHRELDQWVRWKNDSDAWVWARGNMDQVVFQDIENQVGVDEIFPHYRWRDVRTAVDFLYGTDTGYITVDYPGFSKDLHITKHNPVDDCVLDVMMLIYGRKDEG